MAKRANGPSQFPKFKELNALALLELQKSPDGRKPYQAPSHFRMDGAHSFFHNIWRKPDIDRRGVKQLAQMRWKRCKSETVRLTSVPHVDTSFSFINWERVTDKFLFFPCQGDHQSVCTQFFNWIPPHQHYPFFIRNRGYPPWQRKRDTVSIFRSNNAKKIWYHQHQYNPFTMSHGTLSESKLMSDWLRMILTASAVRMYSASPQW